MTHCLRYESVHGGNSQSAVPPSCPAVDVPKSLTLNGRIVFIDKVGLNELNGECGFTDACQVYEYSVSDSTS